ncbi:DUF4097 and DUF4098 domain-containing protein YvlB [Agreia bicolorata]|uniref:DUF4097 and DUF4098 domain-containing protein YvlB n=1 Tax=Agreia bicolorata TaxID=110935 RepID=A0A1T4XXH9_9MICO|nr:DUF4097 family beta strand repeat-containing protein [Agreia bicolorata]SKA94247.1 DUF4097 and DUF4098 domain-containing protein YvlB [Agreia bicolorata]
MAIEKWLVTGPKVIDLELVRSVKISLIGGKIDVIAHDEPGARVEVHSVSGRDLKVSIDGDVLEIDHPQLSWDNFIEVFKSFKGNAKADISIMIPREASLKFGVVNASALISGLRTDARVNSVSGDIVIDDIIGDLDINTVSGEISVSDQEGVLNAHTVTGDITVTGALRKFSADGVSGTVFLDLTGIPEEISNNTVSGDLTVRLDQDVPARFTLNSVSGTLQVDSTITRGTRGRGFNHTSGSLDKKWVEVRANSVSGDITSVRRATVGATSAPSTGVYDAPVTDAGPFDAPEGESL